MERLREKCRILYTGGMRCENCFLIAIAIGVSFGCGGSTSSDAGATTITSVEILPQNAGEIQPGDSQFFIAKARAGKQVLKESDFDEGFTFKVIPEVAGTISRSGLFTASAELPSDVPMTIVSTYLDMSGSATAIVKGTGMIAVNLGYSPASLFNTLGNVRVQLLPTAPVGEPVTIDLGPNALKTVFRFVKAGRYNVSVAGTLYGVNVAQGSREDIMVKVGEVSTTFVEVQQLP